jgi:hypothetical protein
MLFMKERTPIDLSDILTDIVVPDLGSALFDLKEDSRFRMDSASPKKDDLFAEHQQRAWDKSTEARCDFTRRVRITRRASIWFITIWQKSIMGRTLTDIKGDEEMVPFFAGMMSALIIDILGESLNSGGWCLVTTPKRRHLVRNFATRISIEMAKTLHIPFYEDVCSCHTKQRINAEFTVNLVPPEQNIICFDDFVTTGSTLASMKQALAPLGKNILFFAGINNKL